jgi:hypothetical protein
MNSNEKICGPCRACCIAPKIDTQELRKPAQMPCPHLVEKGCGIYERRPQVCRIFLCGWRLLPELDRSWRPDLSGVMLLRLAENQMPKPYRATGPGWVFVILDSELALTPKLARHVASLVRRNAAVFLSVMTPRIQINEQLEAPVAANDMAGVLAILKRTHALLSPAQTGKGLVRVLALYRAQLDRMRAIMARKPQ